MLMALRCAHVITPVRCTLPAPYPGLSEGCQKSLRPSMSRRIAGERRMCAKSDAAEAHDADNQRLVARTSRVFHWTARSSTLLSCLAALLTACGSGAHDGAESALGASGG